MMTDEQLERRLSRYRMTGPRPELRQRILTAVTPAPVPVRTWVGLAALAACAAFFFYGAQQVYAQIDEAQQAVASSSAIVQPGSGR